LLLKKEGGSEQGPPRGKIKPLKSSPFQGTQSGRAGIRQISATKLLDESSDLFHLESSKKPERKTGKVKTHKGESLPRKSTLKI